MNPGLMLDSGFTAGVAGSLVGGLAWLLSPALRFVPGVSALLRSAAQSGPELAAIALPPAEGAPAETAAYYEGATLALASAFARGEHCATRGQRDLWRLSLTWAGVTAEELAATGLAD
jgi:hypothetical protein